MSFHSSPDHFCIKNTPCVTTCTSACQVHFTPVTSNCRCFLVITSYQCRIELFRASRIMSSNKSFHIYFIDLISLLWFPNWSTNKICSNKFRWISPLIDDWYLRKKCALYIKPSLFISKVLLGDVEVTQGQAASLACDMSLPSYDDAIYLVLWFMEPHQKPIYT